MHEPTFRGTVAEAGLNPYWFEMANIREQCSWVHLEDVATTEKARLLVASAVAKAALLEPLEIRTVPVVPSALVIGGGVAGMQAALDVAEAGFEVTLVERAPELGGHAAALQQTFPTLESVSDLIAPLVDQVKGHPLIRAMVDTELIEVGGYLGNFQASVRNSGEVIEISAGAIIVATGFDVFDARLKPELGYGQYPQVITTWDFENMAPGPIQVAGKEPKHVVFIQCVGSRDRTLGNPYCSRICCMVTAKQARLVRERLPHADVSVFYIDVRAFGKGFEEFYDQARESGIIYRRGNPSEIIRRGERVVVRAEDTLLKELVEVEADLVVLAVGMTPRRDNEALISLLKLARSADGFFMEAHPKLRPVDTALAGLFLAGTCQGPKDIAETVAQARAAAAAAMIPLMRGQVPVEAATSFIEEELCAGCGQCAQVCAYSALSLHPLRQVMTVNPVLCQGCGACAATCPSGAINVHHFTFEQFMAQIEALTDSDIHRESVEVEMV
jgi:heterodisulfide reductase subunit A-like polyferredoxin